MRNRLRGRVITPAQHNCQARAGKFSNSFRRKHAARAGLVHGEQSSLHVN